MDLRDDCEALQETVNRLRVRVEKDATRLAELLKLVTDLQQSVQTYLKEPSMDEEKIKLLADDWRVLDAMYEREEDLAAHRARLDREKQDHEKQRAATQERISNAQAAMTRLLLASKKQDL